MLPTADLPFKFVFLISLVIQRSSAVQEMETFIETCNSVVFFQMAIKNECAVLSFTVRANES